LKKLQEENKILKAILNSLAEGVVVTDKDGKFLFINPVAEKIVGLSSENVKPEQWASAYGAYHLDKVSLYSPDKLPLARAIKGEEIKHEVIFIKNAERPSGVYIDVSASPLKNKKGEIEGGTIIIRDITERIQAEIAQKENETRLNDFFNELPIPSYIWQQVKDDFILLKHNKAAETLTHGNVKKFLGTTLTKMYEKSPYLEEIRSNFAQCIKEKKSITHEMQYQMLITKDTKQFVVSYVFVHPNLIMVHTEDITKRKLAEKELRKLSKAVEQTADSVLITDTRGVIEYVNPAFEITTGYKCEEVIGQTPRIFKSGKHDSRFYKNLWDTIRKGKTFRARIINKKRNNEPYWADQTITPMKDNDGNITNYVSVLRDITENVEKQKQEFQLKISEEKNKKFEEMDQMKSRFFSNISHEFRSPLTLILGPSESIVMESNEEETRKKAGTIKRNANHLLGLINQLLDLSKLEAGKMKLKASKGNIVSFVKGITMSFESVAEGKDITLKAKTSNDEIEMYFDKEKMIKILTNLLSNAFKFTQQGGMITVRIVEIENNFVEIKVRDTGKGLSEEELPHIFDRFYQVDSSDTREQEGTGIGLALTKEMVELHHGTISVDSKLGNPGLIGTSWTEFTIGLPVGKKHLKDEEIVEEEFQSTVILNEVKKLILTEQEKNQTEIAIVDSSSQAPQNDNLNNEEKTLILIVEDNTDVREYIKDSLGDDFQIEEAANGEQGVRKAENIIPDLIVSDVMMPKMDGNELTRRLKNDEKTSHIPIILLTAKSEQESKLEGLETGADAYLTKPFNTKELQIRIKNLINIRRELQKKYSKADYVPEKRAAVKKLSNLEEQFMCKVMEVIENHISEEEFSIEQFGKEVGMSRVQLHRKLKALSGKSASNYLRSIRLSKAKKFIEEEKGNISEIAYSVGFSSPAYFTRCFKDEYGYPPSDLTT
jgi:PAS domain S-box-containing protein